ncbi:MAG: hypothetical protein SFW62_01230 [Alphaproteobacteria bacterium]|nr:hypothetical protein [Alphaproteobacteria bacterium]
MSKRQQIIIGFAGAALAAFAPARTGGGTRDIHQLDKPVQQAIQNVLAPPCHDFSTGAQYIAKTSDGRTIIIAPSDTPSEGSCVNVDLTVNGSPPSWLSFSGDHPKSHTYTDIPLCAANLANG